MATCSSFLPGKSHEQRSLAGYSPWGCKESVATRHICIFCFNQAIRFANILSEVPSSKIALFALCVESLFNEKVKVLVTQPSSCNAMDYSPSGLLYPWNSSGKNTGVGSHPLLQGILLTQGSGEHIQLKHHRWIL